MSTTTSPARAPRRVLALGALALSAAVLAAGCSSAEPAGPAADAGSAPSSAPATEQAAVPVAVPPVSVAVNDPGQEPRTGLALDLDRPQQVTLTTVAGIVQTVGGQPPADLSSPPVAIPLTAEPTGDAAADGTVPVGLTLGVPTSPDATLDAALAAEEGSTATLGVRPSAAVAALAITPAPAASDDARAAVEQGLRQAVQLRVALPDAPVGVGARWTTSVQLDSLGLPLRQDVTATLLEVAGTTVRLGLELSQTPLANTWDVPGGGGTLSVDSYPMTGTGEITVDLRRPMPIAGTLELTGRQVYTRTADQLVLSQDVTNRVSWTS